MVYTGGRNGLDRSAYFHAIVEQNLEKSHDTEKLKLFSVSVYKKKCYGGWW